MARKLRGDANNTQSNFVLIIVLAQCFGLFPVSGVLSSNIRFLKFNWKSKKVLYSLLVLTLFLVNTGFQCYTMWICGFNFGKLGKTILVSYFSCKLQISRFSYFVVFPLWIYNWYFVFQIGIELAVYNAKMDPSRQYDGCIWIP